MIIEIPKISPDGSTYRGEEPGEMLDLVGDKFAHADGPVSYDLFVYFAAQELIVQGRLEAPVKVLCCRCAGFYSTKLVVSSFLRGYPITDGLETLDITGDIREDILLELPSYPRCGYEGEGVCPHSGVNLAELKLEEPPRMDDPWGALDHLEQLKEK